MPDSPDLKAALDAFRRLLADLDQLERDVQETDRQVEEAMATVEDVLPRAARLGRPN